MAYQFASEGKESEWNEATLKVIRLHELQSAINYFKSDTLGITDGKFNYIWLTKQLDNLYGEGKSKYNDKERKRIDSLRELIYKCLRYTPPHVQLIKDSFNGSKKINVLNQKNFDMLMGLLDLFETEIKDANDSHGLTTKNKGTSGLF